MQQHQQDLRRLSATYASLPPETQQQMLECVGQQQQAQQGQQVQQAAQQGLPLEEQAQEGGGGGGPGLAAACTCGLCVEGIVSPRNSICLYRAADLLRWA